jgi:hypothetical protein
MITIKPAAAKNFFFDRELVTKFMDRKSAAALARGGGLVRRIAQNSMRSRRKASMPGTPPSRHRPRGQGFTHILFVFDPKSKSVVVGPVLYSSLAYADGTTAPQVNEFGGRVRVRNKRTQSKKQPSIQDANFPSRRFMGPALEVAKPKLPELWAIAVQR